LDDENIAELTSDQLWPTMRMLRDAGREEELSDQALAWFESGLITKADWYVQRGLTD